MEALRQNRALLNKGNSQRPVRLGSRQRKVRDGPEEVANVKTLEDIKPGNLAPDLCF